MLSRNCKVNGRADLIMGGGSLAKLKEPLFDGGRAESRSHRRHDQQRLRLVLLRVIRCVFVTVLIIITTINQTFQIAIKLFCFLKKF